MVLSPFIFDENFAVIVFYLHRVNLSLELHTESSLNEKEQAEIETDTKHEETIVQVDAIVALPIIAMDHSVLDAMTKLHISEYDENACLMSHQSLYRMGADATKAHIKPTTNASETEEWTVLNTIKVVEMKHDLIELGSDLEVAPNQCASASTSCTIEGMEGVPVEIIAVPMSSQPQACPERPLNRSISSQVLEAVSESISPELKTIYPVIMTNDITMDPTTLVCKESKEECGRMDVDAMPTTTTTTTATCDNGQSKTATSCCPATQNSPCQSSRTTPPSAAKSSVSCSIQ